MKSFKTTLVPMFAAILAVIALFAFNRSTNSVEKTTNFNRLETTTNSPTNLEKGTAVLELYTSEGCSSCPPADDVLRDLAKDSNVIALSFHVTYWNRLGWIDSFSQKTFDERQYTYGQKFKANGVYTPQAVINGSVELVGSKKTQVAQAVKNALETPSKIRIVLEKTIKEDEIAVQYKLSGDVPKDAVLQFALVESAFSTKVKHGENKGKILKHDNVVRDFLTKPASEIANQGTISFFPLSGWTVKNCRVVAFVQEKKLGHIIGAAKIKV